MKRVLVGIFCVFYFTRGVELLPHNEIKENFLNATTGLGESVYDEHLLQDIERHLKILNLGQENQHLRYELLSRKVDDIHEQLNQLLAALKSPKTAEIQSKENDDYKCDNNRTKINGIYESCTQALSDTLANDGVYQISPTFIKSSTLLPMSVYCMRHPETSEAWTVIQRRMNGKIDFYRSWVDYQFGFGNLSAEYWLGLEQIHALTALEPHKLWIELGDFENETRSAYYDKFVISNADSDYYLNSLGQYTGNAGDSLTYHLGHKFATKDRNNDFCAKKRKGAWWFDYCTESDLNGEYLIGSYSADKGEGDKGRGVSWYGWHGRFYSLKYAHMAIRPAYQ